MDAAAAIYIAKGICILAMVGTAIGQGYLIGKGLEAMGKMIVFVAMTETTAIFAFVAFFLLK